MIIREIISAIRCDVPLEIVLERLAPRFNYYSADLDRLRRGIKNGGSFAEAAAGKIGEALNIALEHDLERMEMEQKLKGVIYYPLLIIGWSALIFFVVVSKIFPVFANLYVDFGGVLPWTFTFVTNVYHFLFHYWYIVVVLLAGLWYLIRRLGIVGITMSIPRPFLPGDGDKALP